MESPQRGIVTALVQARMRSSRLPGKILSHVLGKPMLQWQMERLAKSRLIDQAIIATSDDPADDAVEEFSKKLGYRYYRGSEANVLKRFYEASLIYLGPIERPAAILVRLTGDCPLIDPFVVDEGVEQFITAQKHGCRYQGYDTDLPDGMDFEVFTWEALHETVHANTDAFEQEHATPYMWRNPLRFNTRTFTKPEIPAGLRVSVDYTEDRQLVEAILKRQQEGDQILGMAEIAQLMLEVPELSRLNNKITRNEGLFKTCLASSKFKVCLHDRIVSIYGLAIVDRTPQPDLLDWAEWLGMEVWYGTPTVMPALGERTKARKSDILVLSEVPNHWVIIPATAKSQLAAASLDRTVHGILLSAASRAELAAGLSFLCQKRFVQ